MPPKAVAAKASATRRQGRVDPEPESDVERFLQTELRFSRSTYVPWGKEVVRAIDFDDCLKLVEVFEVKAQLGAHVDVQVTASNYGGYIWTAWLHNLQGDTALHMAVRQRKTMCVYMLLAMGAATDIENQGGETAGDLCLKKYRRDVKELHKEAFRELVTKIDPAQYKMFPKSGPDNYPTIGQEALSLLREGRVIYTELPKCFSYSDIIPDPKAAPRQKKEKWVIRYDQNTKRKYKYNEWTGEIVWLEEKKMVNGFEKIDFKELIQEDKWSIRFDDSGNKYYLNETTGESTWEIPEAFKSKNAAKKKADAAKAAEDAEYEFKPAGDSDDEDEKVQMEILRKQRIQEELERSQAEAKRLAALEEKARLAREEILLQRRELNNDNRKAQRAQERLCGVSNTPGGWAVGDVWGRNGFTDVLRLIQRQRKRQDKEDEAERHRQSGLTLLSAANAEDRPGISRDLLKGLSQLKGFQKMKFMKMQQLKSLAIEWENNVDPRGDLDLPYRFVTKLSTRTNMRGMSIGNVGFVRIFKTLVGDRIIQELSLAGAGISLIAAKELAATLPFMKSIRILDLSQNALCDDCAVALAEALVNTPTLVKLTLAANRIEIEGALPLVKAVMDQRCSLSYLTMCNNHIRPAERDDLIAEANPFHVAGQQVRFRPRFFKGPGGRKSIYPFTLTPFRKGKPEEGDKQNKEEVEEGKEGIAKTRAASALQDAPTEPQFGILANSPARPGPQNKADDSTRPAREVSFGPDSVKVFKEDDTFETFVYKGQGHAGQPGTPSFRGLVVYL